MKILIFGLSGSGKTTFAQKFIKGKDFAYFNGDEVRKMFNDWEFSHVARIIQAQRMLSLCEMSDKIAVVDFICPFDNYRKDYDIKIWINTIDKSKYENTNKIFEKPKKVDFEITNFNYDNIINEIYDRL
jgi:adenylylsulfate kinase